MPIENRGLKTIPAHMLVKPVARPYDQVMSSSLGLSVGAVIQVQTERLAYQGGAVARHEGLAIFIPLAAPGESLRVRIVEIKKNFARAEIEEILVPSAVRREPVCQYFGDCGGCQLQHITYAAQLSAKASFVSDSLARVGRISWTRPIEVRSADEFGYRSRAQVKVERLNGESPLGKPVQEGESGERYSESGVEQGQATQSRELASGLVAHGLRIGFNRAGSHSVCDVVSCPILTPKLNLALGAVRSALEATSGAWLQEGSDIQDEFELAAGDHGVSSAPAVAGMTSRRVEQTVGGMKYLFGPRTFFQSNPLLLEDLVNAVTEEESGHLAVDLYAGVGLFSARLAKQFGRVLAVESDPEAVVFGRKNMTRNGLSNVEYLSQRADAWTRRYLAGSSSARRPIPDLIVLDPPRAGASALVDDLIKMRAPRITYVSCDPVTLSRDLSRLTPSYRIKEIVAFDLFPQTYHVETIAKLEIDKDRN
ncbi:MAG TPA: class I SAM-dependent RNA methyltransferase [Blastocatellia bacterium]|nr:class I SAM-dependent RNA methyltransferase [Blastocatellia bacterium]